MKGYSPSEWELGALIDYAKKGTVTDVRNQTFTDSCDTSKNLKEYYCDSNDYAAKRFYLCPNACVDGACI